jgi:hypothetical protein
MDITYFPLGILGQDYVVPGRSTVPWYTPGLLPEKYLRGANSGCRWPSPEIFVVAIESQRCEKPSCKNINFLTQMAENLWIIHGQLRDLDTTFTITQITSIFLVRFWDSVASQNFLYLPTQDTVRQIFMDSSFHLIYYSLGIITIERRCLLLWWPRNGILATISIGDSTFYISNSSGRSSWKRCPTRALLDEECATLDLMLEVSWSFPLCCVGAEADPGSGKREGTRCWIHVIKFSQFQRCFPSIQISWWISNIYYRSTPVVEVPNSIVLLVSKKSRHTEWSGFNSNLLFSSHPTTVFKYFQSQWCSVPSIGSHPF